MPLRTNWNLYEHKQSDSSEPEISDNDDPDYIPSSLDVSANSSALTNEYEHGVTNVGNGSNRNTRITAIGRTLQASTSNSAATQPSTSNSAATQPSTSNAAATQPCAVTAPGLRKRKKNPALWQKNIKKSKVARGEEYITKSGNIVAPRKTGKNCGCRKKCFEKFNDAHKKQILSSFNEFSLMLMS